MSLSSVAAILAAAGSGERFNASSQPLPARKQFMTLKGRPVYEWSLRVLLQDSRIACIVITVPAGSESEVTLSTARLQEQLGTNKRIVATAGGASRQESVYHALQALATEKPTHVVIHDAARPLLNSVVLSATIDAAIETGACTVGTVPSDTVKEVAGAVITRTLDRERLALVQTPQGGRYDWLLEAHAWAKENAVVVTDDAGILEARGHSVQLVSGPPHNIKITHPQDLEICEAIAHLFLS